MAAPGLVIIVSFPYRAEAHEEWSQRYHLDDDFASFADFQSTADALVAAWRPLVTNRVQVERVNGYHDTDDPAAYINLYGASFPGTLSAGTSTPAPGDDAVWVRWATGKTNSRGRQIYLRKYFHDARMPSGGTADPVYATQMTAITTFANAAVATGWNGKHIADPAGDVPTGPTATSTYITTRTLHRR